jgi:glycosyltransferase involved in cell wall biosynthesis
MSRGLLRKLVGLTWLTWSTTAAVIEVVRSVHSFRPTAIHAHGFIGYVIALATSRLTGKRLVHTVPCVVAQMVDANAAWLPALYRRTHPAVEHFFTNMPGEQRAAGIPDSKLYVIPGAVDLDAVHSIDRTRASHRSRIRLGLGIPETAFVLMSVGRFHRSKGHEHAIAALAALHRDAHLIVLGDGPDAAALRAAAASHGVTHRVHFVGYREDILEHYAAADVFVRAMTLEGDNMSSLLAMAMRLPAVAFDTGAESDLIPRVGHGLSVPVGDDAALAAAIRRVHDDPALRASLAAKGGDFAERELDVRRTIAAYHGFYREASGRAR